MLTGTERLLVISSEPTNICQKAQSCKDSPFSSRLFGAGTKEAAADLK